MPLNVRRFCTSILLTFVCSFVASAQTVANTDRPAVVIAVPPAAAAAPSAADVMRERVAKAKAYIVVKNYNAAIYELENIRRETADPTVGSVINVLLMNSYLEQGDYKRAQDFLKDVSSPQKISRQNGAASYFAVAGQVVKGARMQLDRYKSLGLSVSDRNLPVEATADVQKMRETLEMIVGQSKVLGVDKKQTPDAMALVEQATAARVSLAKDDYDAKRWRDEIADAREQLANAQSVIINAAGEPTTISPKSITAAAALPSVNSQNSDNPIAAAPQSSTLNTALSQNGGQSPANSADSNSRTIETGISRSPAAAVTSTTLNAQTRTSETAAAPAVSGSAENNPAPNRTRRVEDSPEQQTAASQSANNTETPVGNFIAAKSNAPLSIGSLVDYATQRTSPVYPPAARSMRTSGIVRVEVIIDENGQVAEVQKTSGPQLLQRAATDAVKKWKFKPFVRDGEPVKATGFVSFNFSL